MHHIIKACDQISLTHYRPNFRLSVITRQSQVILQRSITVKLVIIRCGLKIHHQCCRCRICKRGIFGKASFKEILIHITSNRQARHIDSKELRLISNICCCALLTHKVSLHTNISWHYLISYFGPTCTRTCTQYKVTTRRKLTPA